MIRQLRMRLAWLAIALLAFAPAVVSILKGSPVDLREHLLGLYHPLWWWEWVWAWMPALHFPWFSRSDAVCALPGLAAIVAVALGLGLAFQIRSRQTRRKWEGRP